MNKPNEAQLAAVRQLLSGVEPFFRISGNMTLRAAQVFLVVSEHEGLTVTEYARKIGVTVGTVSRHLIDLSERDRHFENGPGLVEAQESPSSRRERLYFLTHRGRALLAAATKGAK